MKNIVIIVIVLIAIGAAYYYMGGRSNEGIIGDENTGADIFEEGMSDDQEEGKLKAAQFRGTLEEVNTGCFADGECYVVVDGKHITTTMGFSQETVGTIRGVEGFGDLEAHIGKEAEVYAQDLGNGTYTLYGSEGFYVKVNE